MPDIISAPGPKYPDYTDLISKADWDEYYEGKAFSYNDPLMLATLRTNERLIELVEEFIQRYREATEPED